MSSLPSHRYEQAQEADPTPQQRSCLPELAPFLKPSLSVRKKITLGYALAVSIPVLGALLGLVVGNRYQTTATQTLTTTYQEQRNLTNLQVLILQNRPAKDLTPLIQNPAAYRQASSKILGRIDQIQTLVNQLEAAETLSILKFKPQLKTYQSVLATFSQEFKTLAQDIQLLQRSNNDKLIQKKILELVSGNSFNELIQFADQIDSVAIATEAEVLNAKQGLQDAEALRLQIILTSILVSVGVAIGLAIATSRAISQPLESLTQVAQQVTRNGNTSLRAIVPSQDEVGDLATALNQLIEWIAAYTKDLNETQLNLVQAEKMSSLGQLVAGVARN